MAFPFQAFSGIAGTDPLPAAPERGDPATPPAATARPAPRECTLRLGDLLVERQLLTAEQRDAILDAQRSTLRPFGLLAERMFGVSPRDVEQAWAQQYAGLAHWEDPTGAEPSRPEVTGLIDRRQAWQFAVVPLRIEDGEAVIATTTKHLARAMRFAGWRLTIPHRFVLCGQPELEQALARDYPMGRLDQGAIEAGVAALARC